MPIIDWTNFTPINSLLGGICIGLAATILLFANGRIMGISGILGDIISFKEKFFSTIASTKGEIRS